MKTRLGLPVLAVAMSLLAAACGGSKSSPSPNSGATAAAASRPATSNQSNLGSVSIPGNLCALITAAEVSKIMGQSLPAPQLSASGGAGGGEHDCQSNGATLVAFSLFAGPYCTNGPVTAQCLSDRSSVFADNKQAASQTQHIHGISGLGSQAYCATSTVAGQPNAVVAVLKNWIYITATTDTCAQGQSLANLLLSKF